MRGGAVALCGALLLACAAAYTVDCNHEYTDCDNEISELLDNSVAEIYPPYIKLGLKLTLSLLFAKGMTVTTSVLNQE
jgi:hypothetical protein